MNGPNVNVRCRYVCLCFTNVMGSIGSWKEPAWNRDILFLFRTNVLSIFYRRDVWKDLIRFFRGLKDLKKIPKYFRCCNCGNNLINVTIAYCTACKSLWGAVKQMTVLITTHADSYSMCFNPCNRNHIILALKIGAAMAFWQMFWIQNSRLQMCIYYPWSVSKKIPCL